MADEFKIKIQSRGVAGRSGNWNWEIWEGTKIIDRGSVSGERQKALDDAAKAQSGIEAHRAAGLSGIPKKRSKR